MYIPENPSKEKVRSQEEQQRRGLVSRSRLYSAETKRSCDVVMVACNDAK